MASWLRGFNPRAPCGARQDLEDALAEAFEFQSTRPMRGATVPPCTCRGRQVFQSTRPMRGATLNNIDIDSQERFQSTRPMRGATKVKAAIVSNKQFQSTRPMRGATWLRRDLDYLYAVSIHAPHAGRDPFRSASRQGWIVSIHAPHAGRDRTAATMSSGTGCFNPRAPCGARLRPAGRGLTRKRFQSTRPMRGATRAGIRRCHLF